MHRKCHADSQNKRVSGKSGEIPKGRKTHSLPKESTMVAVERFGGCQLAEFLSAFPKDEPAWQNQHVECEVGPSGQKLFLKSVAIQKLTHDVELSRDCSLVASFL